MRLISFLAFSPTARLKIAAVSIGAVMLFAVPSFAIPSPDLGDISLNPFGGDLPEGTDLDKSEERGTAAKQKELDGEGGDQEDPGVSQNRKGVESYVGGGKKNKVPYLNPIEGATGTMNNPDALLMVSRAATSKIGLYNIVTNLTEPGVSQGINNAMSQSQGIWANRVAAEQLNLQHLGLEPEGQDMAKGRLNCVTEKLSTMPIDQAIGACSGGNKVVDGVISGGSIIPSGTGRAPTLRETLPDHARYDDSRFGEDGGLSMNPLAEASFHDSPCQGDNEVCGTDYLFNQEMRGLSALSNIPFGVGAQLSAEAAMANLAKTRRDFLDFIGDIRFTNVIKDGNVQSTTATYIPPRKEGSSDALIELQRRARYEDLNALMRKYCEWSLQICSGIECAVGPSRDELIRAQYPTEMGDNNPKDTSGAVRDFWRDMKDVKPLRARLSTSAFPMHSRLIEDLFTLYKRDSSLAGKTGGNGPDGPCGGFYTGNGEPANYQSLYAPTQVPGLTSDKLVNKNAAWHKPIYILTQMIGEASYLDFLGRVGAQIQNTMVSSTALSNRVRIEMLNLLNRAAIKDSRTGSLTMQQEMYTVSMAIQAAAKRLIVDPARESVNQSTRTQQQTLVNAGLGSSGNPQGSQGGN